jgi:hypothetical protein
MNGTKPKLCFLSGNALKILAAIFMVIDHVGVLLFPKVEILRIIGRLAFPIFAYLLAEGAKYTKNKLRYLLTMAAFALAIQLGYYIFDGSLTMSVMLTFTLSLMIIFSIDLFKAAIFTPSTSTLKKVCYGLIILGSMILAAVLHAIFDLDYDFSGCMLPVFPALFTTPKVKEPPALFEKLDTKPYRLFAMAIGTLALSFDFGGIQFYGLLALPLLALYSEARGRFKMKYFFYFFYPLHLIILYGIAMILK